MSALKPYMKPSKTEFDALTVEDAAELDGKNRDIYKDNRRLFDAAKKIAEEIDPTNRLLRGLEMAAPPADFTTQVLARIEKAKKAP